MARSAATTGIADRFLELALLGLISSGCLALAGSGYLDPLTAALTAAGLLLRLLILTGLVRLEIPPRVVAALTLAYLGFYPLDWAFVSRDFPRATVHLVCFLAVVKILTARTSRDFVYVKIIALLQLVAAAILSVNLSFFAFLVFFLLFGVATFTSSEIRRSAGGPGLLARGGLRRFPLRLTLMSVSIALGIMTLTAGLFFLLPRTATAAFQRLVPHRLHLPGFSNEVRLGQIGEVLRQSTPVMHVQVPDQRRLPPLLWRGAALSQFDGKRWFNPPGPGQKMRVEGGWFILADDAQRRRKGSRLSYEVHLNDIASDALFFTGVPEILLIDAPGVLRGPSDTYRLGYGSGEGVRYVAHSYPEGPAPTNLPEAGAGEYLQLPALDPRIERLAREITAGLNSDEARAGAVERHLRSNYAYTTELPSEERSDPLAHFLFERRKGHCEYYASAMAVMLRSIGIPSRVITGFHGGELNPVSGWYVVRASDAHSWVEALLDGRGWATFDPTPSEPNPRGPALWAKVNYYLDAADMFWHEWVVDYGRERQLMLAMRMENSSWAIGAHWQDRFGLVVGAWKSSVTRRVKEYGPGAAGLAVLVAFAWILGPKLRRWLRTRERMLRGQRGQAEASDATLLYTRMLDLLKHRGFEKPAWLTPSEFARLLPPSGTATLVLGVTDAYHELRYGNRKGAAPRMAELLGQLARQK